ncbi:uncharacterized protein PFL1_02047 [Pseudozyma flocculosa PF-1]|uniref:Chalcone isomerase domain-containing protein n=1 Tax=Pseudozyma flocculosa TaxID=84751 RepID=A0A5C3F0K6_9BASI|nr:uncharacterized protein PFL1_02047 [Pseudozyma flocculosa PF-1]EPQ30521.1 hypothetical protein PFL1_02047 [Pseudozyma flocculosa PF-1]SPO37610.1 uncharacterized protein PSFLO_03085 [Pseudozyma flocculosa]
MSMPRIATSIVGHARTAGVATARRAATAARPACRHQSTFSHSSTSRAAGPPRPLAVSTAAVALGIAAACYYSTLSGPIELEAASDIKTAASLPSLSSPDSHLVIDPDTNQALPLYLPTPASSLPAGTGKLRLVGLGVRTVSFLRVRVYVAAFYVDENRLQQVAAQGGFRGDADSIEKQVQKLIDQGAPCAIRIVPVRSTDFAHLRDGFVRALQGRLKKAIKESTIPSGTAAEETFSRGISEVKEAFPRGSVPKGSALDLVLVPTGKGASLNFEYDGKVFGSVRAGEAEKGFTVARELALAYFSEKGEISTPLKKSVEEGMSKAVGA